MTVKLKIAKASFILIVASIIGHILSLSKEVLITKYFGITKSMDALYSAITIPTIIGVLIISPLYVIFIPIFIKYRLENKHEADKFASVVINYILIISLISSIFTFSFASQIIRFVFGGLSPETSLLAIKILKLFSLSLLFTGLIAAATSVLNSFQHFAGPAFSQMFITVNIILLVVFFSRKWDVFTIVWGTILGLTMQALLLSFLTVKKGFKYHFNFKSKHPAIKEMLNFTAILVIIGVLSQCNLLISRIIASFLPSGSIAALSYADKLLQVPMIIFSGSITTAIYPFFALQVAENEIKELKDTFASSIKMSGVIFIPLAVIMIIFAEPVIRILFERGAFNSQATSITSKILICFSFQLLFNYALPIMTGLLFALQRFVDIIKVTVINIISVVLMSLLFIKLINPPVAGIALSVSIGNLISSIFYFVYIKKRITYVHGISIFKSLSKIALIAAISGFFMFVMFHKLDNIIYYSIVNQVIIIAITVFIGLLIFTGLAFLLKIEEIRKLYDVIKNKTILRPEIGR